MKSVATIYAPISGLVQEMNKAIDTDKGRPQLINRDPLGKGWILKIKASGIKICKLGMTAGMILFRIIHT